MSNLKMEELKMKTHAFNEYEAENTLNALIATSLVVFVGLLIIVSSYLEPAYWQQKIDINAIKSQPVMVPAGMSDKVSIEKLREYLILEPEPEMKLSTFILTDGETEENLEYGENETLKTMRDKKMDEIEKMLNLQQNVEQMLTPTTESPMKLESWMVSDF